MALQFTGSTSTGVVVTTGGDSWITLQGQFVADDIDAFDFAATDNGEYFLQGDIYAGDDGIVSSAGANNNDIIVGLGASINAGGDGIQLFGDSANDSGHNIVNDGAINGLGGEGVDVRASFSTLVNNGTITGQGFGVFYSGTGNEIVNNGLVTSNSSGIGVTGDSGLIVNTGTVTATGGNGLDISGANGTIDNSGTVAATLFGVDIGGAGGVVLNSGDISGQIGVRADSNLNTTADVFEVVNSGLIVGEDEGVVIVADEALDRLVLRNGGEIRVLADTGSAVLGGIGDDLVRNSGTIDGAIRLGDGNDTYRGINGTATELIDGGGGSDTIVGGVAADTIEGGGGNDTLRGQAGDDEISGSGGRDTVRGQAGDDVLLGGGGADDLRGGAGDDEIDGGSKADEIHGGSGDDLLTGGGGADLFVFGPNAGFDVITDFADGSDLIDVTAVDVQNFAALSAGITQAGGDAFIDWSVFGGEGVLQIVGAAGVLNGADFVF